MKIACCGSHGVGKSTLCYQLADYFKRNKKNVYLVHEKIRESPFPINGSMSEETSIWVFTAQVAKELDATCKKYDTIICDRSAYDTFIYAEFLKLNKNPIQHFRIAAEEWLETYDYFFLVRPDLELLEDGLRDTDEYFAKGIDILFEDYFSDMNQDFVTTVTTNQIINGGIDFNGLFSVS